MSERQDMPQRGFDDDRWCPKLGVIVVNGCCTDVPVWMSSDGALVLPVEPDQETKVEIGSRIRVARQLWLVCDEGDLGRITGLRENQEDTPRSWFVTMDNGRQSYLFEGEFEVLERFEKREAVGAVSAARA